MRSDGEDAGEREKMQPDDQDDSGNDPLDEVEIRQKVCHNEDGDPLDQVDDVEEPGASLLSGGAGSCLKGAAVFL